MADEPAREGAKFTEAQHFALLESAVERETAALGEAKAELETQVASLTESKAAVEAELAEVKGQMDVLEAEKATALAAAETAKAEFEEFKAELARKAEVAARKDERVAAVKAANADLAEAYFTSEKAQRWAEMSQESFDAFVADITELAAATKAPAPTTETDGVEAARETAAFAGGSAPTEQVGSTFARFLGVTGKSPAALRS